MLVSAEACSVPRIAVWAVTSSTICAVVRAATCDAVRLLSCELVILGNEARAIAAIAAVLSLAKSCVVTAANCVPVNARLFYTSYAAASHTRARDCGLRLSL